LRVGSEGEKKPSPLGMTGSVGRIDKQGRASGDLSG